jgi:hypothetical protein
VPRPSKYHASPGEKRVPQHYCDRAYYLLALLLGWRNVQSGTTVLTGAAQAGRLMDFQGNPAVIEIAKCPELAACSTATGLAHPSSGTCGRRQRCSGHNRGSGSIMTKLLF